MYRYFYDMHKFHITKIMEIGNIIEINNLQNSIG